MIFAGSDVPWLKMRLQLLPVPKVVIVNQVLRMLRRKYVFEMWLIFGTQLVAEFITWVFHGSLAWVFEGGPGAAALRTAFFESDFWAALLYGLSIPALMSLALYPLVRRLGRPMLSRLWEWYIVLAAVAFLDSTVISMLEPTGMWIFWFLTSLAFVVLVWFARQVTAISFKHALLFIGLVMVIQFPGVLLPLHLLTPEFFETDVPRLNNFVYGATAIVHLIVGAAGVWYLVNPASIVSSTRNLLVAVGSVIVLSGLMGGFWIAWAAGIDDVDGGLVFFNIPLSIVIVSATHGLLILITYVARIRGPREPEDVANRTIDQLRPSRPA